MEILFIPLDNRPVSYVLPQQIAELSGNINVLMPPRSIIGGLHNNTQIDKLLIWLNDELSNKKKDYIICNLDTIAYGGLIPSRRSDEEEANILARLSDFRIMVQRHKDDHKTRLYAFSSIMRISNNNINEEEKLYWDKYGEMIFKYSYLTHKTSAFKDPIEIENLENITERIPEHIIDDYLLTRKRNFNINKYYLSWVEENFLDYLVFSQDDTAQYGLNVLETSFLKEEITKKSLLNRVNIQTGADEISCDLLSKTLVESFKQNIKIYPVFTTETGSGVISRYEDRTIMESVLGQLSLCGGKITDNLDEADIVLVVHTPINIQNDHAMKAYPEAENEKAVEYCLNILNSSNKPVMIADIACANGGDNLLVKKIIAENLNIAKLYGYAGWNTTGNTLGSVISTGISRFIAQKSGNFNLEKFKIILLTRLADDWAYQTVVRQIIRALTPEADLRILEEELMPLIDKIAKKLELSSGKIKLSFPWQRTFEVEIEVL